MQNNGMTKKGAARTTVAADPAFAERLRNLAMERDITKPADFSRFVGVIPQTGYKWWAGQTKNISAADLYRIAERFEVRASWLFTGQGIKKPNPLLHVSEGWEARFIAAYRGASISAREIAHSWIRDQESKQAGNNKKTG